MKNLNSFLWTSLLCLYTLYGLLAGKTFWWASRNDPNLFLIFDRNDNFSFYWSLMSILCVCTFYAIKSTFEKDKPKPKIEPLTFKDITEYNNFKKHEKSLSSKPWLWSTFSIFMLFPFWYVFNLITVDYQIDKDWIELIIFYSICLIPVVTFKLSDLL
jgi:glycopeptide antibiotics resistance protein